MTQPATTIDEMLTSSEFAHDPYPTYRKLLAFESPFWSAARKAWLVSRFDQVVGSFRDWQHFSSEGRIRAMLDHFSPAEWDQLDGLKRWRSLKGIIHADPPDHARYRSLFVRAFSTRAVEQLPLRCKGSWTTCSSAPDPGGRWTLPYRCRRR